MQPPPVVRGVSRSPGNTGMNGASEQQKAGRRTVVKNSPLPEHLGNGVATTLNCVCCRGSFLINTATPVSSLVFAHMNKTKRGSTVTAHPGASSVSGMFEAASGSPRAAAREDAESDLRFDSAVVTAKGGLAALIEEEGEEEGEDTLAATLVMAAADINQRNLHQQQRPGDSSIGKVVKSLPPTVCTHYQWSGKSTQASVKSRQTFYPLQSYDVEDVANDEVEAIRQDLLRGHENDDDDDEHEGEQLEELISVTETRRGGNNHDLPTIQLESTETPLLDEVSRNDHIGRNDPIKRRSPKNEKTSPGDVSDAVVPSPSSGSMCPVVSPPALLPDISPLMPPMSTERINESKTPDGIASRCSDVDPFEEGHGKPDQTLTETNKAAEGKLNDAKEHKHHRRLSSSSDPYSPGMPLVSRTVLEGSHTPNDHAIRCSDADPVTHQQEALAALSPPLPPVSSERLCEARTPPGMERRCSDVDPIMKSTRDRCFSGQGHSRHPSSNGGSTVFHQPIESMQGDRMLPAASPSLSALSVSPRHSAAFDRTKEQIVYSTPASPLMLPDPAMTPDSLDVESTTSTLGINADTQMHRQAPPSVSPPSSPTQRFKTAAMKSVASTHSVAMATGAVRALASHYFEATSNDCETDLPLCGKCWRLHITDLQKEIAKIEQDNEDLEKLLPLADDSLVICSGGDGSGSNDVMLDEERTAKDCLMKLRSVEEEVESTRKQLIQLCNDEIELQACEESCGRNANAENATKVATNERLAMLDAQISGSLDQLAYTQKETLLTVLFSIALPRYAMAVQGGQHPVKTDPDFRSSSHASLTKRVKRGNSVNVSSHASPEAFDDEKVSSSTNLTDSTVGPIASINGCRFGKTAGCDVPISEINCACGFTLDLLNTLIQENNIVMKSEKAKGTRLRYCGDLSIVEVTSAGGKETKVTKNDFFISTKFFSWKTFVPAMTAFVACVQEVVGFYESLSTNIVDLPPGTRSTCPFQIDVLNTKIGGSSLKYDERGVTDDEFTKGCAYLLAVLKWCTVIDSVKSKTL